MEYTPYQNEKRSFVRDRAAFIRNNDEIVSEHSTVDQSFLVKAIRSFRFQMLLAAASGLVLVVGLTASWQTILTNRAASKVVTNISASNKGLTTSAGTATNSNTEISSTQPTNRAFDSYVVASDLARYIKIPKISVYARVLQVGIDNSGAIATPNNSNDTAWYNGSAKPGQTGATLIDGHVTNWTSNGVFHDLKKLTTGDEIQLVLGNGTVLNYEVISEKSYPDNNVDMNAALSPATVGKSGLNLITCTGKVKPGTSQYTDRLVIFASLK